MRAAAPERPRDVMYLASRLVSLTDPKTAGLWPRAAALLARQGLEMAMRSLWRSSAPGIEGCSTRAQLLCLQEYLGDSVLAESANHTWWALPEPATTTATNSLPPATSYKAGLGWSSSSLT